MKKTVAVIMTVLLIAGFVSGCGKQEDDAILVNSAYLDANGAVVIPIAAVTPTPAVSDPTVTAQTPAPTDTPPPNTHAPVSTPDQVVVTSPPADTEAPRVTEPAKTDSPAPTPVPSPTDEPIEALNYIPGHVNSNGVNLRQEPNTGSTVLASYSNGKNLLITGRNSEWYRVSVDGVTGYMARQFITLGNAPTPTPKPTPTPTPKPTATPTPKPTATPTPKPTATASPVPDYYTVYPGQFSEADIRLVAALIYKEARYSTAVGMRAVASVVLNRVLNETTNFPNTVHGVIFQTGQFGYSEAALNAVTPSDLCLASARYVFSEHGSTLPKKVLFYRAAYLGYYWTSYTQYYATIEGNNYYYGLYYF